MSLSNSIIHITQGGNVKAMYVLFVVLTITGQVFAQDVSKQAAPPLGFQPVLLLGGRSFFSSNQSFGRQNEPQVTAGVALSLLDREERLNGTLNGYRRYLLSFEAGYNEVMTDLSASLLVQGWLDRSDLIGPEIAIGSFGEKQQLTYRLGFVLAQQMGPMLPRLQLGLRNFDGFSRKRESVKGGRDFFVNFSLVAYGKL